MLIVCPNCATSYMIDPASLGPGGRTVRCARCKTTWFAGGPKPRPKSTAFVDSVIAEAERSRAEHAPSPRSPAADAATADNAPAASRRFRRRADPNRRPNRAGDADTADRRRPRPRTDDRPGAARRTVRSRSRSPMRRRWCRRSNTRPLPERPTPRSTPRTSKVSPPAAERAEGARKQARAARRAGPRSFSCCSRSTWRWSARATKWCAICRRPLRCLPRSACRSICAA